MTRAIRMAGAGGALRDAGGLERARPSLARNQRRRGHRTTTSWAPRYRTPPGPAIPVRDGTDMIEVRGVINSPLIAFDLPDRGADLHRDPDRRPAAPNAIRAAESDQRARQQRRANRPSSRRSTPTRRGSRADATDDRPRRANDDIHGGCASIPPHRRSPVPAVLVQRRTASRRPRRSSASQTFGS